MILVGGVNITPAGEELGQNRMVDEGLVGSGDNMAAGEEVAQNVGRDVGSMGGDDNTLVEMGDIRDSEFGDKVEKKEDPLEMGMDEETVTNNELNRCNNHCHKTGYLNIFFCLLKLFWAKYQATNLRLICLTIKTS